MIIGELGACIGMCVQTRIAVLGHILIVICAIIMLVATTASCRAQTEAQVDTIRIIHKHSSCDYYHGVYKVGASDLKEIMSDCPEAIARLRKANTCRETSSFLIAASGCCIGLSMWSGYDSRWDDEWGSLIAGVALAAISFDLDQRVYKHRNTAVKIFNNKQLMRTEEPSAKLRFAISPYGVGLVVSF